MESSLTKLPAALQKSLHQWYLVSSCALLILFGGMATAHITLSILLYRSTSSALHSNSPQEPLINQNAEDGVIQKRLDELDAFSQAQQTLLPLFEHCIERLPREIQLTQCILSVQKTFECSGSAADTDSVTEFVTELHACGLACTTVSTKNDPEKSYPLQFQIKAKQCLKAP